ncbi:MAG: hypothetical protein K8S23_08495 [Candidatus Cloacimonetes bacterium]|nr:hypothetical protein [Candidatus Cloacimonadota bacterium]
MNAVDKGAVAYIGNSTKIYLNFSIAEATGNADPFIGFTPDELGLFDALMHPDFISIGEIMNEQRRAAGIITGISEELKTRHIYALTLLGDPSLMPYVGIPETQEVSYNLYTSGNPLFVIETTPNAYFALTDEDGNILGAGFTDETGNAYIELEPIIVDNLKLVVTAKNKIPYFETIGVTGNDNSIIQEIGCKLFQNYPNPFNPSTIISFKLNTENTENTELVIYNMKGQKVKVLECINRVDTKATESLSHCSVIWNGTNQNNQSVSSGIYYSVLKQNGKILASKKMMLLK